MTGPITMIEPAECHLPPSDVEAIEEALAPVQSMVWHAPGLAELHDDRGRCIGIFCDCDPVPEDERPVPDAHEGDRIARFIAACSPDRMRRILSRLAELMAENERLKSNAAIAALAAQGQGEPVAWIDATTFHELTANPHGAIALHRWLSLWREDMHGRTIPLYATKPPSTEGEPHV